ncbi:MAG: LysE family translocator [Pseudomonadota bacterium]
MPSPETILIVAMAGLALSATPGPSMLYVLSRSVGQSRAAGLASAIGLGLGGIILAVVAAMGLAAVFQRSTTAYTVLTVAGAAYLIYLGVTMIVEQRNAHRDDFNVSAVEQRSLLQIIWQGVLVEILNPKTVIFFMAFIPPFVEMERGDVTLQLLILGILVPLTAMPSDIFVAFVGGSVAGAVKRNGAIRVALGVLGGVFLIGIGISLFF